MLSIGRAAPPSGNEMMEVTMNAIDLNTTAGREHHDRPGKRDDDHRAINAGIARSIAIALIFATLGFTEWYGSALYGNPLLNSQEEPSARAAFVDYLPAQYAIQARQFDDQ
jgi:hypothetical protein